jgi:hypothetical protein
MSITFMQHDVTGIKTTIRKFSEHTSVTFTFDTDDGPGGDVTFFLKNDNDLNAVNLQPTIREFD